MVYTEARLQHALRVFREPLVLCKKGDLPSENLERHLRSKYAFRKASNVGPIVNATWWQDRNGASDDDEEYDPVKERKKLNVKRRKRLEHKRKAEDAGDEEERHIKRSRPKGSSFNNGTAYVSLRLTSEKGLKLLETLGHRHRTDLRSHDCQSPHETTPSYWTKFRGSSYQQKAKGAFAPDDRITGTSIDACVSTATSLRNGKVLDLPKDKGKQKAVDGEPGLTLDITKPLQKPVRPVVSPAKIQYSTGNRDNQFKANLGSCTQPIEILDDLDKCKAQETWNSYAGETFSAEDYLRIQRESSQDALAGKCFSQPLYYDQPGLITIETAYAHPIDFKFIPSPTQLCDFCADYRMAVLGHGKVSIRVFVDPEQPAQFQEMGDGHRSKGTPCTKMCVSCALDRLLIMRCHCEQKKEESSTFGSPVGKAPFSRIPGISYHKEILDRYARNLCAKDRANGISNPPSKHAVLPICSLCPAPAQWQCCKYQKRDKMRRPCPPPSLESSSRQTSAASTAVALSSSPTTSLPWLNNKYVQTSQSSNSLCNSLPTPQPTVNSLSGSGAIITSPSGSTTPQAERTSPASSRSSNQCVRPPLRGCGLKLCKACKNFIHGQCNGVLDKRKVMGYLRGPYQLGSRADVEWLFKGSALEKCYERW